MTWTTERKRRAAIEAPLESWLTRPDTEVTSREGWYSLRTPSAPGALLNEVILSQVAPGAADRVIDEVIAAYHGIGKPVKWCVGPWTRPEDFGERLARRGFESWEVRGMGIATDAASGPRPGIAIATDAASGPRPGIAVDEVDRISLPAYVDAAMLGWAIPAPERDMELAVRTTALDETPRRLHMFAARASGEVCGTAAVMLRGDYGYLTAAQVLAHARGRGLYRALVDARLAFLRERAIGYAVTHAREATSAPLLEHLGFETLFRSKVYFLEPPA